jgi:hypothetical protein
MTQADSVHSTPPLNTSVELAEPSQETLSARLAHQAKQRERALRRLRKLRTKAADEIDRLLAFLDAVDDTDVDSQCADNPCDGDGDFEPPGSFDRLGHQIAAWTTTTAYGSGCDTDCEIRCDHEPSLGRVGEQHIDQTGWAGGSSRDLEQDHADSGIADQDGLDDQSPFRTAKMPGWSDGNRTGAPAPSTHRREQLV